MEDIIVPSTLEADQNQVNTDDTNFQEVDMRGEERTSLKSLLSSSIGLDLSAIAVPVTYNEPLSFLQRMCEYLHYYELIDKANKCEDPIVRLLYVSAFAITCLSSTERKSKPFNPLLGETFEYVYPNSSLRFVAEQVSHHPPISAFHCQGTGWTFYQHQNIKTKFLGNSLQVTPIGTSNLILERHNEHYFWSNIQTVVHNMIIGRMWIDHMGPCKINVRDATTHQLLPRHAQLLYKQCGWFSRGWHEVTGEILDNEKIQFTLSGKWNEELSAILCPSSSENDPYIPQCDLQFQSSIPVCLWKQVQSITIDPMFSKYEWFDSTIDVVRIDDEIRQQIPLTDTRVRQDRLYVLEGEYAKASSSKGALEEAQRVRKRHRHLNRIEWSPRYFTLHLSSNESDPERWIFNNTYWQDREERIARNKELGYMATPEDATKQWLKSTDW